MPDCFLFGGFRGRLPLDEWHRCTAWGKVAEFAGKLEKGTHVLLRHEDIATTSNVYGDLGMDAKYRLLVLGITSSPHCYV